jgi:hypothetical protein
MAQFRCIEACYAGGVFYSPYPDGRQIYKGDEPPKFQEKRFVRIGEVVIGAEKVKAEANAEEKPEAEARPEAEAPLPVSEEADREIKAWQLKRLSKPDVMGILRKRYNVDVDDTVTRADMINQVIALQAKHNTNQDIAAAVKG